MLNKCNVEFKESMAEVRENFEISKEDPKYMICTICGSKLSNCFWLDFWSLWIDNFHNSGLDYGYARICLKNHRGRVEMTFHRALSLPGHFDSQIKDSSNSFRRRHSSEGVDAKFSSTLPKVSAVKQTPKPLWTPQEAVHQRNFDNF